MLLVLELLKVPGHTWTRPWMLSSFGLEHSRTTLPTLRSWTCQVQHPVSPCWFAFPHLSSPIGYCVRATAAEWLYDNRQSGSWPADKAKRLHYDVQDNLGKTRFV